MKRLILSVILALCLVGYGWAEVGDQATMGWDYTNSKDTWRVTSGDDLVPGTNNNADIGSSTLEVKDIYSTGVINADTISMDEVSAPASPAANIGLIYVADTGGITTPYFKDSAGTATSMIVSATSLDAAYTIGNTIDLDASGDIELDLTVTGRKVQIANTFAGTQAVALEIDAEVAQLITDALLFNTTAGTITDAIDASDAGITNALNAGPNIILLTTGSLTGGLAAIDFTEFDVSASTGSVTINDDGNLGNISIEGTVLDINSLDFVGAGAITSAASSAITLNPDAGNAAGEDLIVTANNIQITAGGAITISPDGTPVTALGIDLTDTDLTNAISVGDNAILGTTGVINYDAFDVDAAGAVTCTALDAGSGTITTLGSLNVGTVVESAVQPAAGNLTLNGATGVNKVIIGSLSTDGITISDNIDFGVTSLFTAGAGLGFRQATEVISSSVANQLDIDAVTEVEIATATLDVNLSAALAINAVTASNISVTTGDITIEATDSGNAGTYDVIIAAGNAAPTSGEDGNDIALEAEDDLLVQCGDDADFDVADFIVDATTTISLDAANGASNFTTTGGILTLSTVTSGDIDILSAAEVDIDASGTSAILLNTANHATSTTGAITLTTGNVAGGAGNGGNINLATGTSAGGTAGEIDLTSAGAVDINATTTFDMLATTTFSIDGTGASNVSATSGNLTLSTITSGDVDILGALSVDIDASGLGIVTLNTANEATADANACGDITLTGGNKGAGTGDGGDIILAPGSTTGGVQGYVKISGDVLVATTEKIHFTADGAGGAFINAPAAGKIEIEATAGGADDITLDGGITVPTGHVLAMTDAGSITLAGEKVTAHKQVSTAIYATANTAKNFGILPIIDNCKITHISVGFVAVPASGAGTVLLEVYNRDGGAASDNLLSAATYDLEGMTNMVTADMSLTATGGDLQPDDSDFVYCVITSNNGDMTGGTGGVITVKYTVD